MLALSGFVMNKVMELSCYMHMQSAISQFLEEMESQ